MNEHIDVTEIGDQGREPAAARTADIGPSILSILQDCRSRFPVKLRVERMRKVDAPEVSLAVDGHRLENHSAGHTSRNAGFEHPVGAEMTDSTPRCSGQAGVCVAVLTVSPTTEREPLGRQCGSDVCPHLMEALEFGARPGHPEHPMEGGSPILLNLVGNLGVEELMRDGIGNITEGLYRICSQCPDEAPKGVRSLSYLMWDMATLASEASQLRGLWLKGPIGLTEALEMRPEHLDPAVPEAVEVVPVTRELGAHGPIGGDKIVPGIDVRRCRLCRD